MGKLTSGEKLIYEIYKDKKDVADAILHYFSGNIKKCKNFSNMRYFGSYCASRSPEGLDEYFYDIGKKLLEDEDGRMYIYSNGEIPIKELIDYVYYDGKVFIFEI